MLGQQKMTFLGRVKMKNSSAKLSFIFDGEDWVFKKSYAERLQAS
jgi:hypothetical protein